MIHANLREAARRAGAEKLKLWYSTPLVPGAAADAAVLNDIAHFLRDEFAGAIERWEFAKGSIPCSAPSITGWDWPGL